MTEQGYIYVLAHPSDPLLVKVGRTTQKPEARLAQHNSDFKKIAGQIVLDTGQEWILIEAIEVPDPVHAETVFWTTALWHPYRGRPKVEVVHMSDEQLQKGLDAARKAGIRPPMSRKKPVRNRDWMIKQLEGTGLTIIGTYRGLVAGIEFQCSKGHVFKESAGVVANGVKGCPQCMLHAFHDGVPSVVKGRRDIQHMVDLLMEDQCGSVTLNPLKDDYPSIWVFVSGSFGFLSYWPREDDGTLIATGVTPEGCPEKVHFQYNKDPSEEDFDASKKHIIAAEVACAALFEFLAGQWPPESIDWRNL